MRCGHIALAGRPNVGKSSLLNALVGEHLALVSSKAQATRLPVVGIRTEGEVQYIFHDLPGLLDPSYLLQERMRALAEEELRRVDVVVHLVPANEANEAADLSTLTRRPILRVYTKGDLVSSERRAELEPSGTVVSTLTGEGLDDLLRVIAARLPERDFSFVEDEIGTQPLRFFAAEYLREAAFELLQDELPYAFTAEIEEFRETADPVYIRANLFVESRSQKQIVIGAGGRMIRQIGQHARERIEKLIGRPVYLETWVQVLPKWRRDPVQLRRFGFPDPGPERAGHP
jgi:GTP-binding protein Era